MDELVADVCGGCGTLVEDWEAHRLHHRDLGVLADVIARHVSGHQTNRLTLGKGLSMATGIPAGST